MNNHIKLYIYIATLHLLVICNVATAVAQPVQGCTGIKNFAIPGMSLDITKTEWVDEGPPPVIPFHPPLTLPGRSPAHCLVQGIIDQRTGVNNVQYGIGFALALPDNWNGRFLFQGGGGLNGRILPPVGFEASGETTALARGFAVVSTDSGHQSTSVFDAGFMVDQEAAMNFLYKANVKVTIAAKQIISRYYGGDPAYSYFVGCSTGGREGMIMSQRYPFYFDGIISGAPAMRTGLSNLADKWVAVTLNKIAPKDTAGKPVPGGAYTETDKKLIIKSLLDACDANDGITDGMIFDVKGCRFDPERLVCHGPKTENCLTSVQARALKLAFGGPKDSRDIQVYPGFAFDTGITYTGPGLPGLLVRSANPVGPSNNQALSQDVDAEAEAATGPMALGDSTWTNLSAFSGHGGKIIFYHGVSDPWFSALDTIGYYKRMSAANGGMEQVRNWSRLFLIPGMGHCRSGTATLDHFDMLSAIVDWVEQGRAPDKVISKGSAFPGRSRPLCPYPEFAHYKGGGSSEAASSFECRK